MEEKVEKYGGHKGKEKSTKSLTMEEKVEILDQTGKKSNKLLSEQCGVGISSISDTLYTLPAANN